MHDANRRGHSRFRVEIPATRHASRDHRSTTTTNPSDVFSVNPTPTDIPHTMPGMLKSVDEVDNAKN